MVDYIIEKNYHIKSTIDYSDFTQEEIFEKIENGGCDVNVLARMGWFDDNEERLSFAKSHILTCMKFPFFIRKFLTEVYYHLNSNLKNFLKKCQEEKNYWLFIFYSSILDISEHSLNSEFCKIFLFCSDLGKCCEFPDKYANCNMSGANYLWLNRIFPLKKFKKDISFYKKKPFLGRKIEMLEEFIRMCYED